MKLSLIPIFYSKVLFFGESFQGWTDSYEYLFIADNCILHYYNVAKLDAKKIITSL